MIFGRGRRPLLVAAGLAALLVCPWKASVSAQSTGVHTTYLWHMHQPIYWPESSTWTPGRYETAYETITLGHSQNDVFQIFDKDDRVADYQNYPKDAISSILDLPDAGAQVSFAGALMENLFSLGDAGWNGGRYAPDWYSHYRTARAWLTSKATPRLDPVLVAFHHPIAPLMDDAAFRMELACAKAIYDDAWGDSNYSKGFFPAEMCFSERLIPALADAGVEWSIVADVHIARACANYPYAAHEDNCDPPNPADQLNPSQAAYTNHFISRGVTVKTPYPYGFQPRRARYVDPQSGAASEIVVVPAANAMGWDEGYGLYGTGDIDAIASANDPDHPMLVLFAHDGDNAWSGGYSYYNENVTQFSHAAAASGYTPSTVAAYLADHPVPVDEFVHVEDGGWVNADGDFGSPQFINWNWPLVDSAGNFDIPGGWAEDERNWAVLTAAQNRVETAGDIVGAVDVDHVVDPSLPGTTEAERAWHYLLAGYESGYMYYGVSLDMEVKASLACNRAVEAADPILAAAGAETTAPTVWLPQRLPWNPGGYGGGSLWGYPSGAGAPMPTDFHVWTFAYDVSGLTRVELMVRQDADGTNDLATDDNETYAGGADVAAWQAHPMNLRSFPVDEPWEMPDVDFFVLPDYIADQYWVEVTGYQDVLLDYYIEAEDANGSIKRTPIQHVYVGDGGTAGPGDGVFWIPEEPVAGDSLTVFYDPDGSALDGASEVWIHYGFDVWQGVTDAAMAWDAVQEAWRVTLGLPSSAASIQFVFFDESGTWDNNGGADWSVPVTGGVTPFVIDGALDSGVELLASGNGLSLWGAWQNRQLYLATEAAGSTAPSRDHFLFVSTQNASMRAAPWAKSSSVLDWDWFLAGEESNGWSGWFDADETLVTSPLVDQAQGTVLEGVLDLETLFAGSVPSSVWLAAGAFGTADGGTLEGQAPVGDGDADLSGAEYLEFPLSVSGVATPISPEISRDGLVRMYPNPLASGETLRLTLGSEALQSAAREDVEVAIFDPSGRRVAVVHRGLLVGDTVSWTPARGVSAGVYLVSIQLGETRVSRQLRLLR